MSETRRKAQETRKVNAEKRAAQYALRQEEIRAQLDALCQIRDNQAATPSERLEAVKMIEELSKEKGSISQPPSKRT